MAGIKFEIEKKYGGISTSPKGGNKELNLVSWNDRPGKFDIRDWDPENEKMGKGITLTKEELRELRDLLNEMEL